LINDCKYVFYFRLADVMRLILLMNDPTVIEFLLSVSGTKKLPIYCLCDLVIMVG